MAICVETEVILVRAEDVAFKNFNLLNSQAMSQNYHFKIVMVMVRLAYELLFFLQELWVYFEVSQQLFGQLLKLCFSYLDFVTTHYLMAL